MRQLLALSLCGFIAGLTFAQPRKEAVDPKEPTKRFGLRQSPETYPQDSPKKTLYSVLRALDKDRYDYLVAHLLEPGYVADQLAISYPNFEKLARAQVAGEDLAKKGLGREFIVNRIRELANQANYEHLVNRIRAKLDNDPETIRDLKRMFKDGAFQDGNDSAVAKLEALKDRALFFKRIGDRWYIENKMLE